MRKVFVLADGTNCTIFSETNIGKLHSLSRAAGYESHYASGVGVVSRARAIDKVFAPNLEIKALDLFETLLALDLKNDDRLYIFGYSRGAVIARTLAMCITSKESFIAAARRYGIYGAIDAQIEFLCLFDPVVGKPRFHRSFVRNHEAFLEPRVKNYVELLAYGERRFRFSSDSYSASSTARSKLELATSARNADSTSDRTASFRTLNMLNTRKCVWFPGEHSDVGGDSADSSLSAHALATALEELMVSAEKAEIELRFPAAELHKILSGINSSNDPKESKRNGGLTKLIRKFFGIGFRRLPQKWNLIQHLAHPTCKHSEHTALLSEQLPVYPDYKRLR